MFSALSHTLQNFCFQSSHRASRPCCPVLRCKVIVHLMCKLRSFVCAGPLNFIFEKAKFNGAVSAQLKEAERQGSSGGCLVRLADDLQSNDASSDINLYNER